MEEHKHGLLAISDRLRPDVQGKAVFALRITSSASKVIDDPLGLWREPWKVDRLRWCLRTVAELELVDLIKHPTNSNTHKPCECGQSQI